MLKQLTLHDDSKILININNIVAVAENNDKTLRFMYPVADEGTYKVKETFEELLVIFNNKR